MNGPLDGYRVIDLTAMVAGPLATMILADQGADVIKIEPPGGGDYTRQVSTRRRGFSASFLNNNRNKRSVCLDLKRPEGRAVLERLVAGADVFIQNFRPGVVERLGFDEASVRRFAPEIVYVSISGFGHRGSYAGKAVYDPLIQALSGLTSIQGGSDEARPRLVRTILPDKLTGITASQAITAALLARERTGRGQHVRLSMLDAVVAFLWSSDMGNQTFVGDEREQETAQSFIDLVYETADGYITVAVQSDREWLGLTRALERPEWLADPRFVTPEGRHQHVGARLELIQDVLRTRASAEWLDRLEAEGVPCVPVLRRSEMVDHPQVRESETLIEYDHPGAGRLRQARPAAEFSVTPATVRAGGPALGEHDGQVLAEIGYSEAEIGALAEAGVIGRTGEGNAT
jgi:crotonobetainyl-CoA:carnitine CoA-transferase CaiB-like acyl-CoA transferase